MNDYRIIPELELIVEYYCGDVSEYDIMELMARLGKDKYFNVNYSHIGDYRDSQLLFDEKGLTSIVDFMRKNNFIGKRNTAIITYTPEQVVYSMLYQLIVKEEINIKVVSTIEAAIEWVELPVYVYDKIEGLINEMKNEWIF